MDTERFAPPLAQVADVGIARDGVQPIKLWPPDGRIGRLRLLAYGFGLYLAFIVYGGISGAISAGSATVGGLLLVVGTIVYIFASVVLLIQRSHDMDLAGWWCLLAFLPLIGLFWLFNPGTPGGNRFGAPPPPNTLWVKILGWAFPVIVGIGIVAALGFGVLAGISGASASR